MAPRKDLAQIAKEGFGIIDQLYPINSRQNPPEEVEYHIESRQVQPCTYRTHENPIITERPPASPQRHYVIVRANDDVPMAPQPFRQSYPYGNMNLNPNMNPYGNTNLNPYANPYSSWGQPIPIQDIGHVHPSHGMAQDYYGVMDGTRSPNSSRFRGVAKMEVWINN